MTQRPLIIGLLLVLAVGCGFRPAGILDTSALGSTQVVDASRTGSSEIVWTLEQDLKQRGVALVNGDEADHVLRIISESWDRRPLSLAEDARTAEYELTGTAQFELLGAEGRVMIPLRSISANAVYLRDRSRLLGSSQEEARLRREIQSELVSRILSAVAATTGGSN